MTPASKFNQRVSLKQQLLLRAPLGFFKLDIGGAPIFAMEFLPDNKLVAATEFGAIFE